MQTAGYLIAVLAELTSGMKDCQHYFQGRPALFLVDSCGDTASVVLDADGIVRQNGYFDIEGRFRTASSPSNT